LLVEDAQSYGLVLEAALQHCGFDVVMVQAANQAAWASRTQVFDVVVSDLNLPDGDAGQVFRGVRAAGGHLPARLIVITAEIDDVDPTLLAQWGAETALPKTADAALLARQLAQRCGLPEPAASH
jgi:DNA-binding response OmpR family regulator